MRYLITDDAQSVMQVVREFDKEAIKEMSTQIGHWIDKIGEVKNLLDNTNKENKRDRDKYKKQIEIYQGNIHRLDGAINLTLTIGKPE